MYGHNLRPAVDTNTVAKASLSYGNPKAINLGGSGAGPRLYTKTNGKLWPGIMSFCGRELCPYLAGHCVFTGPKSIQTALPNYYLMPRVILTTKSLVLAGFRPQKKLRKRQKAQYIVCEIEYDTKYRICCLGIDMWRRYGSGESKATSRSIPGSVYT